MIHSVAPFQKNFLQVLLGVIASIMLRHYFVQIICFLTWIKIVPLHFGYSFCASNLGPHISFPICKHLDIQAPALLVSLIMYIRRLKDGVSVGWSSTQSTMKFCTRKKGFRIHTWYLFKVWFLFEFTFTKCWNGWAFIRLTADELRSVPGINPWASIVHLLYK